MKDELEELMYAANELATLVVLGTVLDEWQASHFDDVQELVDDAGDDDCGGTRMREIKFRTYSYSMQRMLPVELLDSRPNGSPDDSVVVAEGTLLAPGDFELMQYTGLHDSNGKEIYEGDVLDCVNGDVKISDKSFYSGRCLGQVGFVGASFIVWPRPVINGRRMHYGCEALSDGLTKYTWENQIAAGESVIVGNIWENPELLEEDDND